MRKSLSETQRVNLNEFDKLDWIKRHPGILAHNPQFVIGVWYYGIGSDRFKLSTGKQGHLDDPKLQDFRTEREGEKLVRGRVIDYEGLIVCVIYLDPRAISRLPETILLDLKFRCEQTLGQKIDYVLSDSGEVLLERCLLEDCDVRVGEGEYSIFTEDFKDTDLIENRAAIADKISHVSRGTVVYVSEKYLKRLENTAPKTLEYISKRLGL